MVFAGIFTAHFFKSLGDDLSVTTLTNIADINIERIALGILGQFNPVFTPEPEPEAITDLEPDLTALAQSFLRRWAAGTLEASEFTAELWNPSFIAEVGEFLALQRADPVLELLKREVRDGLRISRYRAIISRHRELFAIARNEQGKVCMLSIRPE